MNWYRTSKVVKRAKHMSASSHRCHLCGTYLKPVDVKRNPTHHFPWGMEHLCSCGESGIWTNSIRDDIEFVKGLTGIQRDDFIHGFCNDTFCPFCFDYVVPLQTPGLFIKGTRREVRYNRGSRSYHDDDTGEPIDPSMIETFDIHGCRSRDHNTNIIWEGYGEEYGEGEYEPIYREYFKLRNELPDKLVEELRQSWEKAGGASFPL